MTIGADVANWLAGQTALDGIDVKSSAAARKLDAGETAAVAVITTADSALLVFGGRSSVAEASVSITVAYNRNADILPLRQSIQGLMGNTLHGYRGELSSGRRVLSASQVSFSEVVADADDVLFDQYDFDLLYQTT